jgi:glycerate kinase
MEEASEKADIVLTGEGRIDRRTRMGKVPFGVAEAARKAGCKKVFAFGGSVAEGAADVLRPKIDECFGITSDGMPLEEAMKEETAKQNMEAAVRSVFRSIS